jgi:hypothetical protein
MSDGMIGCVVCGRQFHLLSNSHLRTHGLTFNEYKQLYPNAPTISDTHKLILSERSKKTNQSRVGVPRTDDVKRKISVKNKGNTAHNKGIPMAADMKHHLSTLRKDKYATGDWIHWNTGNITPDVVKNKIRETLTGMQSPQLTYEQYIVLSNKKALIDLHHTQQLHVHQIADIIDVDPTTVARKLKEHNIERKYYNHSSGCAQLIQYIQNLNITISTNNKSLISPYEIDIFIPNLNLGIEYNGIYWHSELAGRHKHYHINKTKMCNDKGVRLVQIWENEWINQNEIVKSRINSLLGINHRIFARKCIVKELATKQARAFFNETHIQGHVNGSQYLGLFLGDELVAAMSLGKSRFEKDKPAELLRYSNKLNCNVIGGASKLLSYFIKIFKPTRIVTYTDLRWNTGNMYKQLGFKFMHVSDPNYFYFKSDIRLMSRIQFQKHKLKDKLENFNPELTEWENMVNNGYNRIWDCGNSKWELLL